ncbi:MAG: inorganic phosphate transporter [Anaerolineales bacterium]|jgi:PiT family inorganic phosphate transporter|nr:inorganic phosphate transporter [Chloroflexota bacterium]MBK6647889.1 inorganic phosphate transporter [Anaerolineales bacterium]MCC6985350.1 inorganic phosphate transporter [Anaerolineales bacterium]
MPPLLILVILLALVFEFINGMRDASNIVATMISSRAFSPRSALGMTAVAEFLGPFLFGITVAKTIGSDIVDSNLLTLEVLIACLCGAIIWNLITWFFGIPSSSSHALIGGLVGAVMISAGWGAVKFDGLYRVLIALFTSPVIGFVIGFIVLRLIYFLSQNATPGINNFFRRGQFLTAVSLAFSHGTNDAQKTMGMITLGLVVAGVQNSFNVPFWVILASAGTMALGTSLGGWRLIRTLGGKFYKIRPVHSFSTQLSSAFVILGASFVGLPVSTTQVVSSAIIGVGASERFGKVRWSVTDDILTAWVLTIPASALFGAGIYWLMTNFT